jgi:hypothetical protein
MVSFAAPEDWGKTTVNAIGDLYWIRFSVSTVASGAAGICTQVRRGTLNSFEVYAGGGDPVGSTALAVRAGGDVRIGGAALPTTTTAGFPLIPTMAGVPTGVPKEITGRAALVYDTTNNRLMAYNPVSATWKQSAAFT